MGVYSLRLGKSWSRALELTVGSALFILSAAMVAKAADAMAVWCRAAFHDLAVSGWRSVIGPSLLALIALAAFIAIGQEVIGYFRLSRRIRMTSHVPSGRLLAAQAAVPRCTSVIQVRDVSPLAYAYGLFRPRIVISDALVAALTLKELKAVLRHESAHASARHTLSSFVWEVLRRSFFFLPALRDLASHFTLVREIEADESASQNSERRALAAALFKATSPGITGVSALAAFSQLSGRIEALQGIRGAALRLSVRRLAVTLSAVTTILTVTVPATAAGPPDESGRCRAEIDRRVGELFEPFGRIRPSGPTSGVDDVQSREIVP